MEPLLFTGYLTYSKQELHKGITTYDLIVPNEEIALLYKEFIKEIVARSLTTNNVKLLLNALATGDSETFADILQEFISNSMSMFDFSEDEPEKSYHLFVLGLLILLNDTHQIKSNRESGFGRYDIMIIPRHKNQLGIVIEFKKVLALRKETLEIAAQRALEQIKEKNYKQEFIDLGIAKVQGIGVAFQGKQIFVLAEMLTH